MRGLGFRGGILRFAQNDTKAEFFRSLRSLFYGNLDEYWWFSHNRLIALHAMHAEIEG